MRERQALPLNRLVRAAETRGQALVMGKVVDHGAEGEAAVHVEGGPEFVRREQESVDAPQALGLDIDEEARAAFAAGEAGTALQLPCQWVAADDLDRIRRIDR